MSHAVSLDQAVVPRKKPWYRQLYVQVLIAIVIGIFVGWRWPDLGEAMQPIGTTFIAAMKMLIGPIVFLTIVGGIASVADLKKVGMTGLKALTYFQVGTIIAMATGLVAINIFRLGDGVHADPATIEVGESAQKYIQTGETRQWWEFLTSSRRASSPRSSRATSCRSSSSP
jgi:aerobic C4-dicarboxylate transport protein